jgi:hypothetical protein
VAKVISNFRESRSRCRAARPVELRDSSVLRFLSVAAVVEVWLGQFLENFFSVCSKNRLHFVQYVGTTAYNHQQLLRVSAGDVQMPL